jgi:hypothetical protein
MPSCGAAPEVYRPQIGLPVEMPTRSGLAQSLIVGLG